MSDLKFDMPPTGASFEARGGWVLRRLATEFGLTDIQAAGIVGNLGGESGLQAIQERHPISGRGGFGWAQWTGPRRVAFENWCADNGLDIHSDEANYGFLVEELHTTQAHTISQVKKTTTVEAAVYTVEAIFERPADLQSGLPARNRFAQRALAGAVQPTPEPVPVPPVTPEMQMLNKIWELLHRLIGGPVVSVQFAVPRFYSKEGKIMSTPLTLPDDQKANVPLIFKDAIGVVHAPPSGGSATSDNEAVATVTVAADDASVDIVSVGDGTCNVTYTNGSVSDTIAVTVAAPTPTSVSIDSDHATFSAKA